MRLKGIERLGKRGIISKQGYANLEIILDDVSVVPVCDIRIQWLARILSEMADEVCDLLDWRDQIEGQMDNPEHPDVEERITENLKEIKFDGNSSCEEV